MIEQPMTELQAAGEASVMPEASAALGAGEIATETLLLTLPWEPDRP